MKNTLKILCLALTGALLLTSFVSAGSSFSFQGDAGRETSHSMDRNMPAIKIAKSVETIAIDGEASERSWRSTENYADIVNGYIDSSTRTFDIAKSSEMPDVKTFKLLWDETGIYCYMEVNDATVSLDEDGLPINCDNIEYFIDANYLRNEFYSNTNKEALYRLPRDGNVVTGWGSYDRDAFIQNSKSISTPTGYRQEIKICWDSHNAENVEVGKHVGFDIQVNDAVNNLRTNQIIWNSWDSAWINPSTMGTLILDEEVVLQTETLSVTPSPAITEIPSPVITETPSAAVSPTVTATPTQKPMQPLKILSLKKVIPTKITSKTKMISGITIKGAAVKLYFGQSRKRSIIASKKTGKFAFKNLKFKKAKKGLAIKIVISKKGYKNKSKIWKKK